MILNFIRVLFSRNHQSLNDGYWCLLVSLWYEGTFPEWLEGTLIRNGPGLYTFGETEMKHVFDGMALLHRFQITDNGKVCQRSFSEMIARRNRAPFYWNICPESLSVKTLEIIYFTRLLFFRFAESCVPKQVPAELRSWEEQKGEQDRRERVWDARIPWSLHLDLRQVGVYIDPMTLFTYSLTRIYDPIVAWMQFQKVFHFFIFWACIVVRVLKTYLHLRRCCKLGTRSKNPR